MMAKTATASELISFLQCLRPDTLVVTGGGEVADFWPIDLEDVEVNVRAITHCNWFERAIDGEKSDCSVVCL